MREMPDPMRTMSFALLLAALLPATLVPAGQALAQTGAQSACPGHLSATALSAVPRDAVYGIALRNDDATGRVVWTAVLSCDRQGDDQAALIGTLVGAVVPAIGQTVAGRAF